MARPGVIQACRQNIFSTGEKQELRIPGKGFPPLLVFGNKIYPFFYLDDGNPAAVLIFT
jgi:hypothetical protein